MNNSISSFLILLTGLMIGCSSYSASVTSDDSGTRKINDDALRVFVYNIHHGRGMDDEINIERIAALIKEKKPHLIALNEVDIGVARSGNIDIMKLLAQKLDMKPVFGKNIDHQGGEYGNGILTSLPLIAFKNLHLKKSEEGEQRGLLQAEVDYEGTRIIFMTTHLDHQSDINRKFAVKQIIKTNENYSRKTVIVAGDFNATPNDKMYSQMRAYFTDVWEEAGEGPGYTIPVPVSSANRRIDYIFYSNYNREKDENRLRPLYIEVINSTASDHLPVYAEFELTEY
ncbi:MAG: endonuclease/exonuclease/phosphatase family protein [Balneolaceae bacterium]